MKKFVCTAAILVSAVVQGQDTKPIKSKPKSICLPTHPNRSDGSKIAKFCNESGNNLTKRRKLMKNGCAKSQIALKDSRIGKVEIVDCPARPNIMKL